MKLSRQQLAKAFLKLANTESHAKAVKALAAYLLQHGRTQEVKLLINDIAQQTQAQHGRVYAKVTSARVVDESLRHELVSLIKELSNASSVEVHPAIDEALIGGLTIETPELAVDLSVRGKLNQLRMS